MFNLSVRSGSEVESQNHALARSSSRSLIIIIIIIVTIIINKTITMLFPRPGLCYFSMNYNDDDIDNIDNIDQSEKLLCLGSPQ